MSSSNNRRYEIDVVLIRHAESVINADIVHLCDFIQAWRLHPWGPWPDHDLRQACSAVFATDLNPALSNLGQRQLADMAMTLKDLDFFDRSFPYDAVFCSPLQRAVQTCRALLPIDGTTRSVRFEVVSELTEANTVEHVFPAMMDERIHRMEAILQHAALAFYQTQPSGEASDSVQRKFKVVLVGHCKYFNHWLRQKVYMQNVDCWRATYSFDAAGDVGRWSEASLLLRTPLSYKHPADYILSYDFLVNGILPAAAHNKSAAAAQSPAGGATSAIPAATNNNEEVDDELDEPFCRICHEKLSERPQTALIRPCLCSGTNAFVHQECLNQWRSTSEEAFQRCLTCHYEYRMKRLWYVDVLLRVEVLPILACLVFLALSGLVGTLVYVILQYYPQLPYGTGEQDVVQLPAFLDLVIEYLLGEQMPTPKNCLNFAHLRNHLLHATKAHQPRHGHTWWLHVVYLCWKFVQCCWGFRTWALGVILVGTLGHIYYYSIVVLNLIRPHEQVNIINRVPGLISLWIISSDGAGTCRVFVAIGSVMVVLMIYQQLTEKVRLLSRSELLEEAVSL